MIKKEPKENSFEICHWATNGTGFKTYNKLYEIISNLEKYGFSIKIIKKLKNKLAKGLLQNTASAKIHGLKIKLKDFKILIKNYYKFPLILLSTIIIYIMPYKILLTIKKWKQS